MASLQPFRAAFYLHEQCQVLWCPTNEEQALQSWDMSQDHPHLGGNLHLQAGNELMQRMSSWGSALGRMVMMWKPAWKAVGNGTVRNPWRIMSWTLANLPNSQHLFANTSNSVSSSLYQYLDPTNKQLSSSQGCLCADEHSWIVSCRGRWSSTPEPVLALGFGRGVMPGDAMVAAGRMPWKTAAILEREQG